MINVSWWINKKILQPYSQGAKFTVYYGGRGSGKSYGCGDLALIYALNNPGSRILCIRGTQVSIRDSSLEILKAGIYRQGIQDYFNISELMLSCKNGSQFIFKGAKSYKTIKSTDGIDFVWIDEATELSEAAWTFIIPTIREKDPRLIISFNPEFETDAVYQMFIHNKKRNSVVQEINYYDNPLFPDTLKEEKDEMKETNYQKYLHVYGGKLVQTVEGALWKKEWFKYYSDEEFQAVIEGDFSAYKRIVTAMDPAGTSHENSDLWGIVAAGKESEKAFTVLDDKSAILSPDDAIKKALKCHYSLKGDRIIGEVNYGGDMIKSLLRHQDQKAPYREVRATRGKIVRAEPIAALYQQGKVRHLRRFRDLEYEMLTFTGEGKSPNRLDAAVWGLWDLSQRTISGAVKITGV